jgi:hypothetical protein
MPRTVDHILHCHQLAVQRRGAGKPNWDRTLKIRDILHRDASNQTDAIAVAKEISGRIRAQLPAAWLDVTHDDYSGDLDDVVMALDGIGPTTDQPSVDELNEVLELLYDWADTHHERVWIG